MASKEHASLEKKIANLLNLAENAGTPGEAEAASRAAERLMLKWGIEEAVIRSRMGKDAAPEKIITGQVVFPELFHKARMIVLGAVVMGMGGMKVYRQGLTYCIMGFESDVNRAVQLGTSILLQADNAQAYWWRHYEQKRYMKSSDQFKARRQFLFSFATVVQQRLTEMRVEEVTKQGTGTDVVLFDRSKLVNEEYDKLALKKARRLRGSYAGSAEGQEAGHRANLSSNPGIGGNRRQIGS